MAGWPCVVWSEVIFWSHYNSFSFKNGKNMYIEHARDALGPDGMDFIKGLCHFDATVQTSTEQASAGKYFCICLTDKDVILGQSKKMFHKHIGTQQFFEQVKEKALDYHAVE